jgi:hypothetical protein
MDKSDRAKLLQLMEERPAVEEWRAQLPDHERLMLNHPLIVWRKWSAATRVKKPRKAGFSANEMGRARTTIEQLQARIEELEQELGQKPDAVSDKIDTTERDAPRTSKSKGKSAHNLDSIITDLLARERFSIKDLDQPESFNPNDLIEAAKNLTDLAADLKRKDVDRKSKSHRETLKAKDDTTESTALVPGTALIEHPLVPGVARLSVPSSLTPPEKKKRGSSKKKAQ